MIDELDYHRTNEIVCPYCGNIQSDSWELSQSGDVECDACEKQFYVEIETEIKYTSKPYKDEIKRG